MKNSDLRNEINICSRCKLCGTKSNKKGLQMFDSENLGKKCTSRAVYISAIAEYPEMGELKKCEGECKLDHPIENCVVIEGSKHNFITNMFESFTVSIY